MSEIDPIRSDLIAFGQRLKGIRRNAKLSIREVAARAKVDKNTVLALEQGRPVRERSRQRISTVYGVLPVLPDGAVRDEPASFHDGRDVVWIRLDVEDVERPSSVSVTEAVQDDAVRRKLGLAGLAQQFFHRLSCTREQGTLRAAVFEVYGTSGRASQTSGEGLIYVLEGSLRFQIGDRVHVLRTGDAVTFDRTIPHEHRPAPPSRRCRILYVQTD